MNARTATETVDDSGLDFRLYGRILRKRLWVLVTFVAVVSLVTIIGTVAQTEVYRATATVLIERQAPNVVSFQEVVALGAGQYFDTKSYYETQFKIIRSRSIAKKVIERLKLDREKPFSKAEDPVAAFVGRLQVEPEKNSHLVAISFDHRDPQRAAEIANAVAETYRDENLNSKMSASREAFTWLDIESKRLEAKVRESEMALQEFREKHDILSFEERQNLVSQSTLDVAAAHTEARRKRIEAQSLYERVRQYSGTESRSQSLPAVLSNKLIQDLRAELVELERQRAELSGRYKASHPEMRKADAQIDLLNERIGAEAQRILDGIKTEYLVAKDREEALAKELDRLRAAKQELDKLTIEYSALEREAQTNRNLFDVLQTRTKETQITESLQANNVRIIDRAEVPRVPIRPRKRLNVALGFLLSVVGGVGLAFFFEFIDNTVKTREDIERNLGLPFLGVIPSLTDEEGKRVTSDLFTHEFPKSSVAENCRVIRTNITFSAPDVRLRKLLVTSAGPQEGKSTTVINLGVVFAQDGKRVLIIDSDLRRPRLHKAFDIPRDQPGLTNLVMGEATLDEVIAETKVPGLSVITCGPLPPTPAELLGSRHVEDLVTALDQRFDWVIFDSPPVVAVTDAAVLSRVADGVILVVKAGKTARDLVSKARRQLEDVGVPILGTVLNDLDVHREGYRYYHYYQSHRGDGDGATTRKKRRAEAEEERADA